SSAHDTASIGGQQGTIKATGTVTYDFFHNGTCTGSPSTSQAVNLSLGNVPDSSSTGTLAKGDYGFRATYTRDSNYTGDSGVCESFSAGLAPTSVTTVEIDDSTNAPWTNTEQTGASAHDTAALVGVTPTGAVTYSLFNNTSCTGPSSHDETVPVNATTGAVPNTSSTGPLAEGSRSFQAVYSGDPNNGVSISGCEPFTVGRSPVTVLTVVDDNSNNLPWTNMETTGASAHDSATLVAPGPFPTGT